MANFRGRLQGNRGEVTRLGSKEIRAVLSTWQNDVELVLKKGQKDIITASMYINGRRVYTEEIE